jgi:hypothetical protein
MSKNGIPEMTGIMVCGHGSRNQNAAASLQRSRRAEASAIRMAGGIRLSRILQPGDAQGARPLRPRGSPAFWPCRACCLPPVTPRTTFPRCSTPIRRKSRHGDQLRSRARDRSEDDPRRRRARPGSARHGQPGPGRGALDDTCLIVVGRGASDPDANSNVSKVMRMLWEGFGFGWGETCYSGVTFPLVGRAGAMRRSSATSASSCFPISCSPACWSSGSIRRPTKWRPTIPRSSSSRRLSQRPSAGHRHIPGPGAEILDGQATDELPDVQVPRAGAGLRGGGRAAAGKPSPPCRGHRRRAWRTAPARAIATRRCRDEDFCKLNTACRGRRCTATRPRSRP